MVPPPPNSSPLVKITDSPWLWLLAFSLMGLVALQMVSFKYGDRQAQIERQYQGRQWIEIEAAAPPDQPPEPIEYSTADNTLIALWPLRVVALIVAVVAAVGLWREQNPPPAEPEKETP